jgi:hypothetical protein
MLVNAIRTHLLGLSDVTDLVSTRVYAMSLPQRPTLPAIRIQHISELEAMHMRGSGGWRRARIQVDCVSGESSGVDPYASADAVSEAAHGAGDGSGLCGFKGTIATTPPTEIGAILPVDRREDYDPEELRQVRVSRDYIAWYRS